MAYCLYVRKSRADAEAEARGEGETLTRHVNALMELAHRRRLNVTQIHREIVSGETIAARPVAQQLLSEVEQGLWEGVLVMEVERLARGDTVDQGIVAQTFKFSGTKIITPMKDYDPNNEFDEEYFEFGLFMSRREYKTINRRLQRGRLASVNEGKYVGSAAPYGYDRVKLAHEKGYTLTPLPAEADTVRLIFALYTQGELQADGTYRRMGVSLIVRRLNDMGIRPRKSLHWSPATVRDILKNPVYVGKVRWNWRCDKKRMVDGRVVIERPRSAPEQCVLVDGKHPPLVDAATFDRAQELLSHNPPRPVNERHVMKNPLSGLMECAVCKHLMVRRPYTNGHPDSLLCANTACHNVSAELATVERRLLDTLREWLVQYRLQWETDPPKEQPVSTVELKRKALVRLQGEYDTMQKQLDNAHDLLEQGIYTPAQFLDRSGKLSERMKKNEAERQVLEDDIALERQRELSREELIPKIERLLETYHSLETPQIKNDMLKEVLEKVVYLKTKNGRWHHSPDDFELTLYPKIPVPERGSGRH